jgi:hypothetical protein
MMNSGDTAWVPIATAWVMLIPPPCRADTLESLQVYSITGQRITDFTTDLKTINIENLQSGITLLS